MKHFKFFLLILVVLAMTSGLTEAAWTPTCTSFVYVNGINTKNEPDYTDQNNKLVQGDNPYNKVVTPLLQAFVPYLAQRGRASALCSPGITYVYNDSSGFSADLLVAANKVLVSQNLPVSSNYLNGITPIDANAQNNALVAYGIAMTTTPSSNLLTKMNDTTTSVLTLRQSLNAADQAVLDKLVNYLVSEIKVQNHKAVCIGHSEGNLFCNLAYRIIAETGKLTDLGLTLPDPRVLEVIGIATPANNTADGRNQYIKSCYDQIRFVPGSLPANFPSKDECGKLNWNIVTGLDTERFFLSTTGSVLMPMLWTQHFIGTYITPGSANQLRVFQLMEGSFIPSNGLPTVFSASKALAPVFSGTGSIGSWDATSWTSARGSANGYNPSRNPITQDTTTNDGASTWTDGGSGWYISRMFTPFNTQGLLSDTDLIIGVNFCVKGGQAARVGNVFVVGTNQSSTSTLSLSDYGKVNWTAYSKAFSNTNWTAASPRQCIPLTSSGFGAINRTGPTLMALVTEHDFANRSPAVDTNGNFAGNNYGVNNISTAKASLADQPSLEISYLPSALPAVTPIPLHASPTISIIGANPTSATLISSTASTSGVFYQDLGASAVDYQGKSLSVKTVGYFDQYTLGTYYITYIATDADGYSASAVRTVNVVPGTVTPTTGQVRIASNSTNVQCTLTGPNGPQTVMAPTATPITGLPFGTYSLSCVAFSGTSLTVTASAPTLMAAANDLLFTVTVTNVVTTTTRCPVAAGSGSIAAQSTSDWNDVKGLTSGFRISSISSSSTWDDGATIWNNGTLIVMSRHFLPFDTRTCVPTNATVTSAKLWIRGRQYVQSSAISLVTSTQASPTSLSLTDFAKVGSVRLATDKSVSDFGGANAGATSVQSWQLNSAGIAALNIGGYTNLAIRTQYDLDNQIPVLGSGNNYGAADLSVSTSPAADQPYLEVTYGVVPSSGSIRVVSNTNNVSCTLIGPSGSLSVVAPTTVPLFGMGPGAYTLSCIAPSGNSLTVTSSSPALSATVNEIVFTVTVTPIVTTPITVRCPVAAGSGSVGSLASTFSAAHNAQVGYMTGRNAISQDAKAEGANVWTNPQMTDWYITRMFLPFDTRTCVPSNATVTDVTLHLSARSAPSTSIATLTTSSQGSPLALTLADFPKVGSVRLADDKDAAVFGTNSYTTSSTWKLNSLGVAAFNKGGYTQLAVVATNDFQNSSPVWPGPGIADIATYAAAQADQPYLEVTYKTGTGTVTTYGPPVMSLNGLVQVTLTVGQTWQDPGATVISPKDGDISNKVIISSPTLLNLNLVGTYTLTYSITDSTGQSATPLTRTVTVVAAPPPISSVSCSFNPSTIVFGQTSVMATTVVGGTAPFTYIGPKGTFSGISANTYSVTIDQSSYSTGINNMSGSVQDSKGSYSYGICTLTILPPGSTQPPPSSGGSALSAYCYFSPTTVTVGNTSTLNVVASGGTAPYTYLTPTYPATSLGNGIYTVKPTSAGPVDVTTGVSDSKGSSVQTKCSLSAYDPQPTTFSASCTVNGSSSPITVAKGATLNYATVVTVASPSITYSWSGLGFASTSSKVSTSFSAVGTYNVSALVTYVSQYSAVCPKVTVQ